MVQSWTIKITMARIGIPEPKRNLKIPRSRKGKQLEKCSVNDFPTEYL